MKIHLTRKNEAVHFEAVNADGNSVHIDGSAQIGGEGAGARPMELLLMGLGGCSGVDVVSILTKQKQYPSDIQITVTAERKNEVPALFDGIHVHFALEGDVQGKKAYKAIELSMEKYCSVGLILGKSTTITWSAELNQVGIIN